MRAVPLLKRTTGIAVALTAALALTGATPATAAPVWAPADTAAIHPGIQTFTAGSQCTANYVFTDSAGAVYIGQAAHCAGTDGNTATNGCTAGTLPEGTAVDLGTGNDGTIVYSSWVRMQAAGETNANACSYNDFALIRVHSADLGTVNPSIPFWGGPVGVGGAQQVGDTVLSYGNSGLRFGLQDTSPKQGVSLGDIGGGWSHTVWTATPGIPGDSGSAFLDASGNGIGVLSTVAVLPFPLSNNVSDLARVMAYAASHGGPAGLTLVPGTEAFTGPLI